MTKAIKFFLPFLLLLFLIAILSRPIPAGETNVPPLGPLLNPFSGFWQNGDDSDQFQTRTFDLPQLTAPVKVIYDQHQIPHIFAQTDNDAFFMQGYLLATHRLWQMDIATRSAAGRLSEVIGPRTLNTDTQTRRNGMGFAAENTLEAWKTKPEFDAILAYTNGVNAYIDQLQPEDYPIEFKILNYQPEAWTPLKSCLYQKNMAAMLCSDQMDIELTNAVNVFGDSVLQTLYPDFYDDDHPIIPKDVQYEFEPIPVPEKQSETIGAVHHTPNPKFPEGIGSNNWAVAGEKTASGFPILCNDPHLGLTLPSIWFQLQIHTPNMNAYGVALPGIPGIIIGFNKNVAWGVTNVGHDVSDLYRIHWADEAKTMYWLDGKKEQATLRIEAIEVLGQPTVYDTVRYTVWGPVTYPASDASPYDLAMRWIAHDPIGNEMQTFFKLNTAKNHTDYRDAIRNFSVPPQNMVFADNAGDIAITVQGRLPIKRQYQGMTVQEGDDSGNAWGGFIPAEQLPTVKNPARGFVASANQVSTGSDYPYFYHGANGFAGYRGRTLVKKMEKMNNITPQDMMALQNDVYVLRAAEALPKMLEWITDLELDEQQQRYIELLKKWDYEYQGELEAPVIFDKWFGRLYTNTWDEIYSVDDTLDIQYPSSRLLIQYLHQQPDNGYFDQQNTPQTETAKEIVQLSFSEMSDQLKALEEQGKGLTLYENKTLRVNHLGFIPAFSRFDVKVQGHPYALNAIGTSWGPSWRMIVALNDQKPTAWGIFPGGQSGNPGSPYYDNKLEDWAKGRYYELEFMETMNGE